MSMIVILHLHNIARRARVTLQISHMTYSMECSINGIEFQSPKDRRCTNSMWKNFSFVTTSMVEFSGVPGWRTFTGTGVDN